MRSVVQGVAWTTSVGTAVLLIVCSRAAGPGGGERLPVEFVTAVGKHKFHEGRVVVEVRPAESGSLPLRITRTEAGQESSFEVTKGLLAAGKPWFVYVENTERLWVFDGEREAGRIGISLVRKPLLGGGQSLTWEQTFKAGDAGVLKDAPKAVRERLPKALLKPKTP